MWHPVMDSNHRMTESKSVALPTWRTRFKMAPQPGIEPGTERLTVVCSTAELSRNTTSVE